jgi:hypothetical protein
MWRRADTAARNRKSWPECPQRAGLRSPGWASARSGSTRRRSEFVMPARAWTPTPETGPAGCAAVEAGVLALTPAKRTPTGAPKADNEEPLCRVQQLLATRCPKATLTAGRDEANARGRNRAPPPDPPMAVSSSTVSDNNAVVKIYRGCSADICGIGKASQAAHHHLRWETSAKHLDDRRCYRSQSMCGVHRRGGAGHRACSGQPIGARVSGRVIASLRQSRRAHTSSKGVDPRVGGDLSSCLAPGPACPEPVPAEPTGSPNAPPVRCGWEAVHIGPAARETPCAPLERPVPSLWRAP